MNKKCLASLGVFTKRRANSKSKVLPKKLSINKPAKDFVQAKFWECYSGEICKQLEEGVSQEVDIQMSKMKPLTAQWMMDLHNYLISRYSIFIKGCNAAGIKNCH